MRTGQEDGKERGQISIRWMGVWLYFVVYVPKERYPIIVHSVSCSVQSILKFLFL